MEVDLITTVIVGIVILLFFYYVSKQHQYFLSKPLPCVKPSFLLGSSGPFLFRNKDVKTHIQELYDAFPDAKITGFYDILKPTFMIRDPEVIKKITVKDFDNFMDHTPTFSAKPDSQEVDGDALFGNSLFALHGQKWRDMRSTLSPAFTGSKMRHMFDLVAECGRSMAEFLASEAKTGKRLEYEMKDMFTRFGTDVIATVAFGIKVDSLRERENDFYLTGKKMLNFQSFMIVLKFLMMRAAPKLAVKMKMELLDSNAAAYFKKVIANNMQQRSAHGIVRNDMIHMLMEVRKGALKHQNDEESTKDAGFATVEESQVGKTVHTRVWTENELIAQCFIFFLAGFDTLSTGLTFLTYELTINPDIQNRLYEEVMKTEESLNGKPLTYEVLQKMEYMDMVVSETLRKWPPGMVADRMCTREYRYDDGQGTSFTIEKGSSIWIPSIAIHNDPRYYPNPEKFDPERFSDENKSKIIPGTYIPFGSGPRNCIGSRLALMEMKSIIYYLLKEFRLEPTEKTQIPLRFTTKGFTLHGEKGVWLEFKPRN